MIAAAPAAQSGGDGVGLAWVVGQGGLLGSHLARKMTVPTTATAATAATTATAPTGATGEKWISHPAGGLRLWTAPGPGFSWAAPDDLRGQLDQAAGAFFDAVAAGGHRTWSIFWAAGAGVVGSTSAALGAETEILGHALGRIAAHLDRVWPDPQARPRGLVFLASSAGGVYGRCPDSPATEASPCVPVSDYGREKLRQEERLRAWAAAHGVDHLIGRISNLYGPGQNLGKSQGLITHLVRSLVLDQPVHLYVSLDTLRDYIHVDDCAQAILATAGHLLQTGRPVAARGAWGGVKIFASEQAASISALIGIISRVTRRRPRVVYAAPHALTEQQPRRLTFRSIVLPEQRGSRTGLPVGISQVHRHLLGLFRDGKLAVVRPARTS